MRGKMFPRQHTILGDIRFDKPNVGWGEEYEIALAEYKKQLWLPDNLVSEEEDVIQREVCANQILDILKKHRHDSVSDAIIKFFTTCSFMETEADKYGLLNLRELLKKIEEVVGREKMRKVCWHIFEDVLSFDDYLKYVDTASDGSGADFYMKCKGKVKQP